MSFNSKRLPTVCDSEQCSRNWNDLAGKYPEDRDCLASFIVFNAAEVLAGSKPANLVRIPDRKRRCGRNLFKLWQRYHLDLLENSRLSFHVLSDERSGVLVLFYDAQLLQQRLKSRSGQSFLRRFGYRQPSDLVTTLEHLSQRFSLDCPHEVGVFLGYPLKDVAGFCQQGTKVHTAQCQWKIFGPARRSLKRAAHFEHSRQQIVGRMMTSVNPQLLLHQAA